MFQQGSATDQEDLFTQLRDFLDDDGWTIDNFDDVDNELVVHFGTVYVSWIWTEASPFNVGMFHALTAVGGSTPGDFDDDSGNGDNTLPIDTERVISNLGPGPFENHWFFSDEDKNVHVVVEYAPGFFRHFAFGILTKVGTWTGGEYAAGHFWLPAVKEARFDNRHTILLDAHNNQDSSKCATLHCEGLDDQDPAGKWGVIWGGNAASTGLDSNGEPRENFLGGVREGFISNSLGWLKANPASGFIPLLPIQVWRHKNTASPVELRLMGIMPSTKLCNVAFIAPGEEVIAGGDTWVAFPWVRKTTQAQIDAGEEASGNSGVAIRKVV